MSNQNGKIKVFSMFSGIGGFELGIINAIGERADFVAYSEIDKYAIQIYEKHFNHKNYGDATRIIPNKLPDFDLLVGGFPCQAFSIAGKRGGFNDTRGTLFFDIARILSYKRPKYLVLENVKGLLSHDRGKTFQTILGVLTDLGYLVEWQVLNSKNFGVPQNRERVFIIGHLGGECRPKVFPIEGSNQKNTKNIGEDVSYTIDANYAKGTNTLEKGRRQLIEITKNQSQGNRVYNPKGIATTVASQAGGQGAKTGLYAVPVLTPDRPKKRQNGRRFKEDGDPSFTLTGQDKHGIYDGAKIRRLTPTECERLQGFPDGWTKGVSDTQRYKTLGNAVTVNVVKEIINRLYG